MSSSGVDATRVNEIILNTSGAEGNTGSEAATIGEIVTKADALDAAQADQVSPLLKKVTFPQPSHQNISLTVL
jgi:hypothetical protein